MEQPQSRPEEVNLLNNRGIEIAQNATELLCREAIDLVYEGVSYHLQKDKELIENMTILGYPEGEEASFFVIQKDFVAPRENEEFVRTFSTRLEPEGDKDKYMVVHIPANGREVGNFDMPDKDTVDAIYIEHHDQETHWYTVKPTGLFEYIPLAAQNEDTEDILSDDGIWQWVHSRIPEGTKTIVNLFEDIVNWNTAVQDSYTIIDPPEAEA